jgi:uncharacterized protein with HEPN domain
MSEPKRPLKLLSDVVLCIDLLEEYTAEVSDAQALLENQEKIDAIERRFGIIGETLTQLKHMNVLVLSSD